MLNTMKLALAAGLVLGAASVVQAGNDNKDNEQGGYRVGHMGQHFSGANPAFHRSMRYGGEAYAFVPGYTRHHHWGWDWNR
jgi:opacity protein-like surface antigen